MINKLLDAPYWDELEERLVPLFNKDPELKIIASLDSDLIAKNILHFISRHPEKHLKPFQHIIDDASVTGMSRAEFFDLLHKKMDEIKEVLIRDYQKVVSSFRMQYGWISDEEYEKSIKELKKENNLEKNFLEYWRYK